MTRRSTVSRWLTLALLPLGCTSRPNESGPAKAPAAARVIAETSTSPLLTDTARTAVRAGAGALQVVGLGVRNTGDSLDGFAFLPHGSCALVYARGGGSIVDLDLFAYADDGTQYGSDEAPDDLPTLIFCAETRNERIFLAAKVAQGQGPVAIGLHDVPKKSRQAFVDLVGARQKVSKLGPDAEPWPALNEKVSDHLQALGGTWRDVRRVALPIDARVPTRLDAHVPPSRCLDVLTVPEDEYFQVEVTASDATGRILARGTEHEDSRYLVFCADEQGAIIHLEFRPQSGQGLVLVAQSSSVQPGAQLDFQLDLAHVIMLGSSRSPLWSAGSKGVKSYPFPLQGGSIRNHTIKASGCARHSIVIDESVELVRATVRAWSEQGDLLAEGLNHFGGALVVCHTGTVELEIESDQSVAHARLVSIPAEEQSTTFSTLPLASSRALSRHDALTPFNRRDMKLEVTALELLENKPQTLPLQLPSDACTTIALGLTASNGWVELRLRDATSQTLLSRAWGRSSAGLSFCSTSEPLSSVIEIRQELGSSSALLIKSR